MDLWWENFPINRIFNRQSVSDDEKFKYQRFFLIKNIFVSQLLIKNTAKKTFARIVKSFRHKVKFLSCPQEEEKLNQHKVRTVKVVKIFFFYDFFPLAHSAMEWWVTKQNMKDIRALSEGSHFYDFLLRECNWDYWNAFRWHPRLLWSLRMKK